MADEKQEFDLNEFKEFEGVVEHKEEPPSDIETTEHKDNLLVEYEQEETPKETPKEEPLEVKPQEKVEKENPESFKYFQSLADKRLAEKLEEQHKREQLEKEIEQYKVQLNPPKQEELLTLPQPPRDDDPLEAIRYAREMTDYNTKFMAQKFGKMDAYFQTIEAERQAQAQQNQIAQQKAWYVGQMTKTGLSPEEASQALADFSKDADNPEQYFKDLADFWRFRNQSPNQKAQNMDKRAIRQQGIAPLGVIPSENEPQNIDPSDAFFNDIKQSEKRYF